MSFTTDASILCNEVTLPIPIATSRTSLVFHFSSHHLYFSVSWISSIRWIQTATPVLLHFNYSYAWTHNFTFPFCCLSFYLEVFILSTSGSGLLKEMCPLIQQKLGRDCSITSCSPLSSFLHHHQSVFLRHWHLACFITFSLSSLVDAFLWLFPSPLFC